MTQQNMSRISPTAHYTGEVWHRHGLSHDALSTRAGRWLHMLLRPLDRTCQRLGYGSLDAMLLARHQGIDRVLARAVDRGEIGQVLEIAAGLSARGVRVAQRHGHAGLVYVESDLPAMAARKRHILDRAGLRGANHRVVALDALAEDGPASLGAVLAEHFDPGRGLAIITEGLIPYLDPPTLDALWRRIARALAGFAQGLYLSDIVPRSDLGGAILPRIFLRLLSRFTRGQVFLHFDSPDAVATALRQSGFDQVEVLDPAGLGVAPGRAMVRIIAARTSQRPVLDATGSPGSRPDIAAPGG